MDLDRINSIFDAIDTNKSGDIDPSELILHLLALGQDHESISALFKAMDTDGNGSVGTHELAVFGLSSLGLWQVCVYFLLPTDRYTSY